MYIIHLNIVILIFYIYNIYTDIYVLYIYTYIIIRYNLTEFIHRGHIYLQKRLEHYLMLDSWKGKRQWDWVENSNQSNKYN